MAKDEEGEGGEGGYDPDLDVLIAEAALDDTFTVQVRSYDENDAKLYFMRKRQKKDPYRSKSIPASLMPKLTSVLPELMKKAKIK